LCFVLTIFFFLFLVFYGEGNLRSRNRRLEVVAVEVALEVEVGERLTVLHTEETLELGIRRDVVLVLEVVLLDIGRDGLGDIGAALLGALGHTEETAEVIGERGRELEDRGLAGLDLLTLNRHLL